LRLIVCALLILVLYFALPVYLTANLHPARWAILLLFYSVNICVAFFLLHRYTQKKYRTLLSTEGLQEEINILNADYNRGLNSEIALNERIRSYSRLKDIIEDINQDFSLDSVAQKLVTIAFSLIARGKGACILYLIDRTTQRPYLFKTKKEDKGLIIKAKEGDIFDLWVLRHISPLLIEDAKKDFRFDLGAFNASALRPVASLISCPLVTEHRFFGMLRLDDPAPNLYSQDDLRLLLTICDIGTVALENSELYQITQDLAIHDGLTGLFTKGYFKERLREECKRGSRQGQQFSLLMIDVDYFKNYNDKFGHTAGDIVLKRLSDIISGHLKDHNAVVSRFGGEEFCVVLPRIDKKKAIILAQGLRLEIEKTKIVLRKQETSITASIGVAAFPEDASSEDELILKADRAMYAAKQKGRNRVYGI